MIVNETDRKVHHPVKAGPLMLLCRWEPAFHQPESGKMEVNFSVSEFECVGGCRI